MANPPALPTWLGLAAALRQDCQTHTVTPDDTFKYKKIQRPMFMTLPQSCACYAVCYKSKPVWASFVLHFWSETKGKVQTT